MKFTGFILMALLTAGCSTTRTRMPAEQAGSLAKQIANDKAVQLYGAKPFLSKAPARFVKGEWIWQQRCGFGSGDIETIVHLTPTGELQSVDMTLLDNRSRQPSLF